MGRIESLPGACRRRAYGQCDPLLSAGAIRRIYDNYGYKTEILAASIRSVPHVREAALAGADVATLPPAIFRALISHPLTDKGLATFLEDARKAGMRVREE